MKKLLPLLLILLIPSTLAISTDLGENQTFQPGQTLILEVLGNILQPIQMEDVELKRVNVQVPWDYDVKRLNNRYFIWGILPNAENNYTLNINDIATTINGQVQEVDFTQDISTSGDLIPYSIRPGFATAEAGDLLEFNLFLNQDVSEEISITLGEETYQSTLNPGTNTIELTIPDIGPGITDAQIGIYELPILVLAEEREVIVLPPLRFFPRNIESIILIDQLEPYPFSIINDGEDPISGLSLEYNSEFFLIEPEIISVVEPNGQLDLTLNIRQRNIPIEETIILRSGEFSIEFPITVGYTEDPNLVETPYLEEGYEEEEQYFCAELNGKACSASEVCSTEPVASLDEQACCLGSCSAEGSDSDGFGYVWIGWLIGIIVLIILIVVARKYKKSKNIKTDPLKKRLDVPGVNSSPAFPPRKA